MLWYNLFVCFLFYFFVNGGTHRRAWVQLVHENEAKGALLGPKTKQSKGMQVASLAILEISRQLEIILNLLMTAIEIPDFTTADIYGRIGFEVNTKE